MKTLKQRKTHTPNKHDVQASYGAFLQRNPRATREQRKQAVKRFMEWTRDNPEKKIPVTERPRAKRPRAKRPTAKDSLANMLSMPLLIMISGLATCYGILPWYQGLDQETKRLMTWYGPVDHRANMMVISCIAGYYLGMIFSLVDLIPSFQKYKMQKETFTLRDWLAGFTVSNINMWIFSWFITIPGFQAWKLQGTTLYQDPIDPVVEIIKALGCVVVVEVWFYLTHRALHRWFYSIHSIHHQYRAPIAVASMYAHPLEFIFGNVAGVLLGPVLTGCHPVTACWWGNLAILSTSASHSGYWPFAQDHDLHHQYRACNYGVAVFMDRIMGTDHQGIKMTKK